MEGLAKAARWLRYVERADRGEFGPLRRRERGGHKNINGPRKAEWSSDTVGNGSEVLREQLHAKGLRVTQQRLLIFQLLRQGRPHMSPEEFYLMARERTEDINISTVYRNLNLLTELGLVRKLQLQGGQCRYELPAEEPHHHLICLGCARIVEFECPFTEEMQESTAQRYGFQLIGSQVDLVGYCPLCQEERKNKPPAELMQKAEGIA